MPYADKEPPGVVTATNRALQERRLVVLDTTTMCDRTVWRTIR